MGIRKMRAPVLAGILGAFLGITVAPAFEWPQLNVNAASFASGFAQLRGGILSGSLVFGAPQEVFASDPGVVLVVLREVDDGSDSFHSPLGNAVIIDHNDDMVTVYGNLRAINLIPGVAEVDGGHFLGVAGFSGWQPVVPSQTAQGLEFQMIDTRQSQVINPRVLMPHLADEPVFRIYGLSMDNNHGDLFRLSEAPAFPAGVYLLYYETDPQHIPYRTIVSVNGTTAETLTYDAITERNGRLTIRGKRYYTREELYPGGNSMLLGEVPFLRGRNTIRVVVSNINGVEGAGVTYLVENY
ncbi:MAG: hypothetical protein LBS64_03360 [Spirochaetaceae bacterium]|jgi:hypothetical protein|nr:hypothetical protein [Spirochaetaceae bacterium]